jgi:TonB dependent receptor/Carboxypeptidase regulatory-like domain/TonB-dependent Receptor Plug Domain
VSVRFLSNLVLCATAASCLLCGEFFALNGNITDLQNRLVPRASIRLEKGLSEVAKTKSDDRGSFTLNNIPAGDYTLKAEAAGFAPVTRHVTLPADLGQGVTVQFEKLSVRQQSIVITAKSLEPEIDLRNAEVFNRTLFTRDDQVFQQLNAGIDAGQHEGGGKSLEIRRFGFNLDHGGVNGGLKVLVDDVQQNQGTQGHGQGYLGALKALSPELIQEVTIVNGPFSPEYGDFSGLGIVHIRQRESLPDEFTARLQGGNFDTGRAFLAWSPGSSSVDSYLGYEGSYTNGPFDSPGRYRRDNVNANYTKTLSDTQKLGFRFIFGRNDFYSSGQVPLDLVNNGTLDRFGYIDPTDGGRVRLGTASSYYSKSWANGDSLKADGFISRSLFDLYSNFTFFLNDPVHGDAFQQHDSRLQEGSNVQYRHSHHLGNAVALFTGGGNFHDNQINVGLYPRDRRVPTGVTTRAHAHVTNESGYLQESVSLWNGRLLVGGGLRFDEFRYGVEDKVNPEGSGVRNVGRWQGKGNLAFTPSRKIPVNLHINYGRGINSVDARGVVQRPDQPRLATTDFYQVGTSSNWRRVSVSTDVFLIDHSNEQVYIPDDGSFDFKGPSRAYGYETKVSVELNRYLSLNSGVTKIGNAFFKGGDHRVYVDSAPHFVANAGLTLSGWHRWSGSLRMREVNHYRLDGDDPSIVASGCTVFDLGLVRQLSHRIELNLSLDNLLNRDYYETQNYFESRVTPIAPIIARIHGTPAYPLTAVAGITLRFGAK